MIFNGCGVRAVGAGHLRTGRARIASQNGEAVVRPGGANPSVVLRKSAKLLDENVVDRKAIKALLLFVVCLWL